MDDRSEKIVEQTPEEIRADMGRTHAALTDKLECLEDRVTQKMEDVQHKVEQTVDKVTEGVHDTVRAVKQTFDVRQQVHLHPWGMFGGAVLAGFVVGRLGVSSRRDGGGHERQRIMEHTGMELEGTAHVGPERKDESKRPGILGQVLAQFDKQAHSLESVAVRSASSMIKHWVQQAAPGLARYLDQYPLINLTGDQMRRTFLTTLCVVVIAGCNDSGRPGANPTPSRTPTATVDRDNTGVNARDRSGATKTPIDQNENQKDIDITAHIRKRVVDTKMSIDAQNAKIITQNGKVTLRGPVKSEDEKKQIVQIANDIAGAENVDNQLEIQP